MKDPQLEIDLKLTTPLTCSKCNGEVFSEGVMLRKASRFLTGTAQDALIPIPVFACAACGNVNEEFLPAILRGQKKEENEAPKPPINSGSLYINKD